MTDSFGRRLRAAIPQFLAVAVLTVLSAQGAYASCGDRPGTPTDIQVEPIEGGLHIKWRDTTRRGEGSCHDIEIKRTQNGDTSHSVTGAICLGGASAGAYDAKELGYGQAYCVRMKARDHAGTQGCVSQNWSATVCGSTGSPPLNTSGGAAASPSIPDEEPNVDRTGNDYKSFKPSAPDFHQCQRACTQDNNCAAWTYVKPDSGFSNANTCYLKNPIPAAHNNKCCVSGGHKLDVR
jgi:hypothetical protein